MARPEFSREAQKSRLTKSRDEWLTKLRSLPKLSGVDIDRLTKDVDALISSDSPDCASINVSASAASAYAVHLLIEGYISHGDDPQVLQAYVDYADAYGAHARNLHAEYALCLANRVLQNTLPS